VSAELVDTIEIVVKVNILRYEGDQGPMYDWRASNGDEPDEWFETAEEAMADARNRY